MESPFAVYRRFLGYYLRKLRDAEVMFRRGQDEMVDALKLIDQDLTQIKQAHAWIIRCTSEDPAIAEFSLAFAGIDGRILRLRLSNAERILWYSTALAVAR